MTPKKSGENGKTLRLRAEKIFNHTNSRTLEKSETNFPEEVRLLLHELRVHQIELEMQNEELLRTQQILEISRERYNDLYDQAPVGYLTSNEHGVILEANLTFSTLIGEDRSSLPGQPLSRYVWSEDQEKYYHLRKLFMDKMESVDCELRLRKKNGAEFWAQVDARLTKNANGLDVYRVVISNISERKKAEEQLRVFSLTDELTGLSNRRGFYMLAEQQIKCAIRLQRGFVLMAADIDGLKPINDTWGHQAGDQAIIIIAESLRATLRDIDILARIGGDEFAGILIDAEERDAAKMLERLATNLALRNQVATSGYTVSVSVGTVQYDPQQPKSLEELLVLADERLYKEKRRKRMEA